MPYIIKCIMSWLGVLAAIIGALLLAILAVRAYRVIRGAIKRVKLRRRLEKLCKKKCFSLEFDNYYFSLIRRTQSPEIIIKTPKERYAVKFIACLKYRDTYVLTGIDSYYTTNNSNPIMVSFGKFSTGLVMNTPAERKMFLPGIVRVDNSDHIKKEENRKETRFPEDCRRILCVHPMPVELKALRGVESSLLFDGDEFSGCTIMSGKGLLDMLD